MQLINLFQDGDLLLLEETELLFLLLHEGLEGLPLLLLLLEDTL